MGRCKVPPYEGEKDYIFVSYSHQDESAVYPILEVLSQSGCRLWYDEGIIVGSEWPEMIAEHLSGCKVFLAFISPNSVQSHNCRKELNFAIQMQKNVVSVVLKHTELSLGMKMQMATTQAIIKYKYENEALFYSALLKCDIIQECKAIKEQNEEDAYKAYNSDDDPESLISDEKTIAVYKNTSNKSKKGVLLEDDPIMVNLSNGNIYSLNKQITTIGRAKANDIVVTDLTVGRRHAEIVKNNLQVFYRDADSINGSIIDSSSVEGMEPRELFDLHLISIAETTFLYARNEKSKLIKDENQFAVLSCLETNEKIPILNGAVKVGRSYKWPGGTLSDKRVSRLHGTIVYTKDKQYCFVTPEKEVTNGTYLNGEMLGPNRTTQIGDGDELVVGNVYHIMFKVIKCAIHSQLV